MAATSLCLASLASFATAASVTTFKNNSMQVNTRYLEFLAPNHPMPDDFYAFLSVNGHKSQRLSYPPYHWGTASWGQPSIKLSMLLGGFKRGQNKFTFSLYKIQEPGETKTLIAQYHKNVIITYDISGGGYFVPKADRHNTVTWKYL